MRLLCCLSALVLTILVLPHAVIAQIYSCGGFIRSPTPIDFLKIKVKLLTPEGHLKHEEDVNVQNGYYMIPVYNKGRYSLRVAANDGWYFEPESYDFTLDGTTDKCSKNEDIDFSLTGFSISGVVESGSGTGPEGLALTLKKDGQVVGSAVTAAGGKYQFKALPGKYEVSASTDSSICVGRGNTLVEVKNEPIKVQPNLKISGYQLTVKVANKNAPLPAAQVLLYAATNPQLSACSPLKEAVPLAPSAKFVCSLGPTAADGQIVVPCLAPGKYQLEAKYTSGNVQFNFEPKMHNIEVSSSKAQASFSVSGFVSRGQLRARKAPIRDAEILLDGQTVARTNDRGEFQLENLQESASIKLTARLPHHHFSVVKTSLQLPNIVIPEIQVEAYDVCGSVELDERGSASKLTAKALSPGNSDVVIQSNSKGEFCQPVKPGKYELNPDDSSLMPRGLPLDVSDSPLLDLRFTHFKTDAEVRAVCIGSCPQMTVILLLNDRVVQKVKGTDHFLFHDIGPAEYKVKIEDGGYACWEKPELQLSVQRAKPSPLQFIQHAFYTTIDITHEANLKWSHLENKQLKGEEKLKAGLNNICVSAQGRYKLQFSSCIKFDREQVEHIVPNTLPVVIVGVEAALTGRIAGGDESITVKVKSAEGEKAVPVSRGIFAFNHPISSQGDILLIPQSTTFLFEPPTATFQFRGSCNDQIASFSAVKGIFIDGRIEPAVEGVQITSTNRHHAGVVQNAVSDRSGRFRLGPVKTVDDYDIVAELDGYKFTPKGPSQSGHFTSVKLSQLSVVLSDSETGGRLDGVLLSVVGGIDHRSNKMIDKTGQIKFPGLAPGDYFLRPILQEYKFEPSTTKITIREGEHENVELKGKRVAYSAYGNMRQMSNSPVANVVIEALSEQCEQHQSESVTDSDGSFRLRGLKPGCSYRLYPKGYADSNAMPPSYPNQYDIEMTAEDVRNLQFVMMPFEQITMLAVEMEFDKVAVPASYRVTVSRNGEAVQTSIVQSPVTVFYMNGLKRDGAEYSVRVEPDKPPMSFSPKTVFFNADAPVRVVRVPMSASRRSNEVEISFGSLLSVPFFGLLALFFFNQNKSIEMAKQLYERFTGNPVDRRKKKN